MKKTLYIVVISICFCVVLGFGIILYLRHVTAPLTEGKLELGGLQSSVNIFRDNNGVPHIFSKSSDEDVLFGLGFVHAQDRFWQMEFQRRVASGRLSELFGKKTLDADKYLRTLGFYKAAESDWAHLNANSRKIIESYTSGVNAFIQRKQFPLEVILLKYEPQPWTVIDSIAWQKIMAWNLQRHSWLNKLNYELIKEKFGQKDIKLYYPDYPALFKTEQKTGELLGIFESSTKGSNAWVISGEKTNTAKPLLANDVHLSLSAPGLWYLAELHGPKLHVTGATIPGLPAVIIGHNENIAWGVTNGYNDAADLYILNNSNNSEPIISHEEIIKVRFSKDIRITLMQSKYGPIINAVTPELKLSKDKLIALKWPTLMPGDTTAQSFLDLNYAQNWSQFKTALKSFVAPTQTFLYADRIGNIGFYYPGKLPVRHWESLLPTSPDKNHQWDGFIPYEKLPHALNPKTGIIASANNQIVGKDYPYSLNARWPVPPYRISRIIQMLNMKSPLTFEYMMLMQADDMSLIWEELKPYLLQVQAQTQIEKDALKILKDWDGKTDRTYIAPTVFAYWLAEFKILLLKELQFEKKSIYPSEMKMGIDTYYLYQYLHSQISQPLLQSTFKNTLTKLSLERGANLNAWAWGKVHQAEFIANGFGNIKILKRIWNRSIQASGGEHTVNAGSYDPLSFKQIIGATYREIIDLSDFDNSVYMIPIGQSGNPFSKHYDDFLKPWRDVKYIKIKSEKICEIGEQKCLILTP